MNKPGELIYLPSSSPILNCEDGKNWKVSYPDKPGYYIVCEQKDGPAEDWLKSGVTTILYDGGFAWVLNKHIRKEF